MNEIKIDSIEELLRALNELPNHYIYRGHADADWLLESSLERLIGRGWSAESARKFEDFSLKQFKPKFHLYDRYNTVPMSKLAWLAIMQHHGVPTRLLDFSESPYVALYFALEAYQPQNQKDFAVIAIDYSSLMDQSLAEIQKRDGGFTETRSTLLDRQDNVFDEIVDRFSYDIAWVAEPDVLNARLDRQAGSFLLSGNRERRIEEILTSQIYANVSMLKYRIDHSLYAGSFALLRKMNMTSKSLYGDLDGLARAIRMQMQVYSI